MKKFLNKYSIIIFFLIIIEQALVASSTYLIIQLGESIVSNGSVILWLVLFVMSLTLVFIPRIGINYFSIKSKYYTFNLFINNYENNYFNKPILLQSRLFSKDKQPYFVNQTWLVTESSYDFIFDFIATLLNIIFNILVISLTIDPILIVSYIIIFFITLISLKISKKRIDNLSTNAQQKQATLNESLISGWDTILIGNKYNYDKWHSIFRERLFNSQDKNIKLNIFANIFSMITMFVSFIPIIWVLIFIINSSNNIADITALVVTLPRQVTIIQYISILIDQATQFSAIISKVNIIESNSILKKEDLTDYSGNIFWDKIYFYHKDIKAQIKSIEEFVGFSNNYSPGRYVIRGENGSGKSTFLTEVKKINKNNAFYLPHTSKLYFDSLSEKEGSTGQQMIIILEDIYKNVASPIIILDEWDANLDEINIDKLSALIDKMASDKCVIECRHR